MAALGLLLALLLPPALPAASAPGCRLRWAGLGGAGGCRGAARGCAGGCESGAFPARAAVRAASGLRHNVTAVARCCTLARPRKVRVRLECPGGRHEDVAVVTAAACRCDMCRLGRY
ncbi:glycoprotein hormone alpha-2 [Dromaius novaehollandiae]|uniref:glycoprotein hormone alpha-2 n=1 Tax=Dromaius novaehollandiae TaxID=8790 RepID=UPI00311DE2A2